MIGGLRLLCFRLVLGALLCRIALRFKLWLMDEMSDVLVFDAVFVFKSFSHVSPVATAAAAVSLEGSTFSSSRHYYDFCCPSPVLFLLFATSVLIW